MNKLWVWLEPSVPLAVHEEQGAEHVRASGPRDPWLFKSLLALVARPVDEVGFAAWLGETTRHRR